ncbi:hypothetical protein ACVWZD_008274 [Streptomyces sp. TE3672]
MGGLVGWRGGAGAHQGVSSDGADSSGTASEPFYYCAVLRESPWYAPAPGRPGQPVVPTPVQVRAFTWSATAVSAPSVAVNWPEPFTVTPLPDWMSQ